MRPTSEGLDSVSLSDVPLRFADHLQASANAIGRSRSGEKSRLKLMAAAARLLDSTSYRDLLVERVCQAAGVAKGTFYIYFDSKDAFLRSLAVGYVAFELERYPRLSSRHAAFANTRSWIAWYEGVFAANVGVLRCLIQMGGADPAMQAIWHQRNGALVDRAMRGWEKRNPTADPSLQRLALRTAGGMLDQSLFERHGVQPGPGLDEPKDFDLLVDLHALLNFRALYACDPPPGSLPGESPLEALLRPSSPA